MLSRLLVTAHRSIIFAEAAEKSKNSTAPSNRSKAFVLPPWNPVTTELTATATMLTVPWMAFRVALRIGHLHVMVWCTHSQTGYFVCAGGNTTTTAVGECNEIARHDNASL